jgi:hypothetical protein
MDLSIIPECFIDTNLVETIAPPIGKGYNHQKGWPNVVGHMQGKLNDSFALGIIDKDKRTTDYIHEFTLLQSFNGQLELYKHNVKHHYIIYIIPASEKFMMQCAAEVGLDLSEFEIKFETLKELTDITKSVDSKKDQRFKSLFRELKHRGAISIIKLSVWVEYLKSNNYQSDIEVLKNL